MCGEERGRVGQGASRCLLRLEGTRGNLPVTQGTVLVLPKKPPMAVHDSGV